MLDREVICEQYGVSQFELEAIISQAIAESYKFYGTASVINDDYVTGYIEETKGSGIFVRKTIKMTKVNAQKVLKSVGRQLESFIPIKHKEYVMSVLSSSGFVLEGTINEIIDDTAHISFTDKRLAFFSGEMRLCPSNILKKDILKNKYTVGSCMSFSISQRGQEDYLKIGKNGFTLSLTRKSDMIIKRHLHKIEEYMRKFGFSTPLSVVSVSHKKNLVVAKALGVLTKKQIDFISGKLGMTLVLAKR